MYKYIKSIDDCFKQAMKNVAHKRERHYHRCERKRFNGKTFRHKTKYIYQRLPE